MTLFEYDNSIRERHGIHLVACDEAGRGAWMGPIVAAAVMLPSDYQNDNIHDSKKLSESKRHLLMWEILNHCLYFSVVMASPSRIDENGVHVANRFVLEQAIKQIQSKTKVDCCVADGTIKLNVSPLIFAPKMDDTSLTCAAASILAKTFRDEYMIGLDKHYYQYQLNQNKGYINPAHIEAVNHFGITSHHRKSYNVAGIKEE